MEINHKILCLCIFSLVLSPIAVYAENYTVKSNGQTITIIINPNNAIVPSQNDTGVNSQNNTQLVNVLQHVLENQQSEDARIELLIQNQIQKQETDWTYGDVLIGSASIVGLFSVSSFVTTRFDDRTKSISAPLLSSAIFVSGLVMVAQLYIMTSIVTGFFSKPLYDLTMILTIIGVLYMMSTIAKIIRIEHRGKKRKPKAEIDSEIAKVSKEEKTE